MRWIVFLLVGSSLFGTFAVLRWGLKPRPIPQINPTPIEDLSQAGVLTYQRLRQFVREQDLVLAQAESEISGAYLIWQGFLSAARYDNWQGELRLVSELPEFGESPQSGSPAAGIHLRLAPYVVHRDQLERIQPPCEVETNSPYLSCAAEKISRKFFRRNHSPEIMRVAVERHGLKDFIIFVYQPQGLSIISSWACGRRTERK